MVHPKTVRVVGVGMTRLGKLGRTSSSLMQEALQGALGDAGLSLRQVARSITAPQ